MAPEAPDDAVRIAMWSGPRNISTAMMRSFSSRDDTFVSDEPFYAHYLSTTDVDHPGREEVLRHHETSWQRVVEHLTGPVPEGRAIWYQKHMTHHMLPHMDRAWMAGFRHAFLIRDPARVVASLHAKAPDPSAADTGIPQQLSIYRHVRDALGQDPPVVDAHDVGADPEATLRSLCHGLGIPFDPAMLAWEPGLRETDGVWARHWYDRVASSTGFRPPPAAPPDVPADLQPLVDNLQDGYEEMRGRAIEV